MANSLFGETQADGHGPVEAIAATDELIRLGRHLPAHVYFGTSSWSFPGWRGLVYEDEYTEAKLARDGLPAYCRHPLLRAVGIDRGYYQALGAGEWARYAHQVPEHFRFVIKAPSMITDAVNRATAHGHGTHAAEPNAHFLDADFATERFVLPALEGLGEKLGVLVLQFAPMPAGFTRDAQALIGRLAEFLAKLPRLDATAGPAPVYAVELRNPELLTPRLVHAIRQAGARLCLGIHARMPGAARQAAALRSMDAAPQAAPSAAPAPFPESAPWALAGPLVVRWNLHAGLRYEQARARYAPFDRLTDADLVTRGTVVHLIRVALRSGQPAYVIVNNKAEGCAPLTCVELARALLAPPPAA